MAEPILRVRGISKTFDETPVLVDVDLELNEGEILGLMGASGSGKSVLLKLILGLLKPDRGEVWFRRTELTCLEEHELPQIRSKIGYVFQGGALFDSLTIQENLSYPLRKHTSLSEAEMTRRVNMSLSWVGLEGTNEKYPGELSGGMRRRVGLLRATMLEPKLVLFDEPTSGLDPVNVANFITQITRLRRDEGISGILVTHDPALAMAVCERVALLNEGKIRILPVSEIDRSKDPLVRAFFRPSYQVNLHEQAT